MNANIIPLPDRRTVATRIASLNETDQAFLLELMDVPARDDSLIEGLLAYIDEAASARILNSLKLEKAGAWFGDHAPARLQIRLMEAARSSQHAAYLAFRTGLVRSGGLEKAWPKA
jgi:hypothetical protein